MRSSLIIFAAAICSIFISAQSFAQNPNDTTLARIVYTNSERTAILAKTVGVTKVDTLFTTAGTVQVKNLAVLASSKDGNSILIGGKGVFNNPINNALDSAWAIARIDAPFKNTGFFNPITLSLGGAKILKAFSIDEVNNTFHFPNDIMQPLGVLTPNENEWYVTLSKTSSGNGGQWFFHGNFNGSGVVDSFYVDPANPAISDASAKAGYHMSNLAVSEDGLTMLAFVFDQCITSDKPRAQLFRWKPSTTGGDFPFLADKISTVPNFRNGGNPDTAFGFAFRVIPNQQNPTAEIAFAPNTTGDLVMYSFRWNAGNAISLAPSTRKIIRNKLPGSLHFFAGKGTTPSDNEVHVPQIGYPDGNGGDMIFSPGGDSVVFVTSRGDDFATPAESGIYIYDISKGTVTLVENDPTKMERQPIFTKSVIHKFVPPPPPPYTVGTASLDKTSLAFGSHFDDGTDKTTMISTLTADNGSEVIVTKAVISGPDAANFSVTLTPPLSATVKGHQTYLFPVTFAPTAVKSYSATLTINYIDSLQKGEKDSLLIVQLSGEGKANPNGGVEAKAPAAFNLSVIPNPFTQATQITVTAQQTGSTTLEVRDVLGKEIYSSKSLTLGIGEKFTYSLNANALHLAPGEYFVFVRSGGEEVTRKVIYVK